jgi:hypothetical protein
MHPVLNKNMFQVAYVTTDLDAAIAQYSSIYGIDRFLVINTADFLPKEPALRAGFAWHGSLMIELVQPLDEYNTVYTDALRDSHGLTKLHHFGHVCSDEAEWLEVRAALDAANIAITRDADVPGLMKYIYADFRSLNGHYREYILQHEVDSFFGQVPRN